jgi:tripartite-type tricarboxylate transporter receptor subunit TctC
MKGGAGREKPYFSIGRRVTVWYGLAAPKDTPAEIIDKLNREIVAAPADAKMRSRLADLGSEPLPLASAGLRQALANEAEKWARVVRFSDAKPE